MTRVEETKTFVVNGATGHCKQEREENDFYATSPLALKCLFKFIEKKNIPLADVCLEPACGMGHLSKLLETKYKKVISTDLIDRGYGISGIDFLKDNIKPCESFDVITNPPYKYALEFVNHSLDIISENNLCAMYLKLTFLEGINRYKHLYSNRKPKYVLVLPSRIGCAKNGYFSKKDKFGNETAGSAIAFA